MSRRKLLWQKALEARSVCDGGASCHCGGHEHHSHRVVVKIRRAEMIGVRIPRGAKGRGVRIVDGRRILTIPKVCTKPMGERKQKLLSRWAAA